MKQAVGDPAESRRLAFAEACYGFDQCGKRRSTPDATGVTQRQHALDPTIALLHCLSPGFAYAVAYLAAAANVSRPLPHRLQGLPPVGYQLSNSAFVDLLPLWVVSLSAAENDRRP